MANIILLAGSYTIGMTCFCSFKLVMSSTIAKAKKMNPGYVVMVPKMMKSRMLLQ